MLDEEMFECVKKLCGCLDLDYILSEILILIYN